MRADLRYLLAGLAGTAGFTFLALAFPDLSRFFTIPAAIACFILTVHLVWPDIREFAASPRWGLKRMWPQYLMAFAGCLFFIGLVAFLQKNVTPPQEVSNDPKIIPNAIGPVLRLVSIPDTQIRWPQGLLLPQADAQKEPLAFTLKNIGQRAINVDVSFGVSEDLEKLRDDLKNSIFTTIETEANGELKIPIEFVLGKPTKIYFVGLKGENVRKIDLLDSGNSASVMYPIAIQNTLSLRTLQLAYVVGERRDEQARSFHGNSQEENLKHLKLLDRITTIPLLNVTLDISYTSLDGKTHQQKETIRSIFKAISTPRWVYEDARKEKLYLEGGFGLLAFEDKDNPDDGFFARAKRDGIVSAH